MIFSTPSRAPGERGSGVLAPLLASVLETKETRVRSGAKMAMAREEKKTLLAVFRSRWSRSYLRPGAGAEIIFIMNTGTGIYYRQFGGCQDEGKNHH